MDSKIVATPLDFDRTLPYVKHHIGWGHTLSKATTQIDFSQGEFFSFLPENADPEKIYQFDRGWQIPQTNKLNHFETNGEKFRFQWLVSADEDLYAFISNFVETTANSLVLFENVIEKPDEQENRVLNYCFGEEVYHIINQQNNTIDQISHSAYRARQIWHFLCVLTANVNIKDQILEVADFEKICENIRYLIIIAYDGESYIVWKKDAFKAHHKR